MSGREGWANMAEVHARRSGQWYSGPGTHVAGALVTER